MAKKHVTSITVFLDPGAQVHAVQKVRKIATYFKQTFAQKECRSREM